MSLRRQQTGSPQKSPQVLKTEGQKRVRKGSKSFKRIGSSGRIRTYNPSVNSPGNLVLTRLALRCYAL